MNYIANHLYQSTFFAAAVALVTLVLRHNHARIRYWLWMAASLKFLLPFALLVSVGSLVRVPAPLPRVPSATVHRMTASFEPAAAIGAPLAPAPRALPWERILGGVWALGTGVFLLRWARRWHTLRHALRDSEIVPSDKGICVRATRARIEPGVFGLLRPVLLMPAGIAGRLTQDELEAIVTHELTHVRRRDNLTAALHMAVECFFWFHPAVWWIGMKLVEERERACDEAVLRAGNCPETYAQGIVAVCKFYMESPLRCASGVSGANLRKRIEAIMLDRIPSNLTRAGKALLAAAVAAAFALPLTIGMLRASAQTPIPSLEPLYGYEVASVKPSAPNNPNTRIGPGPQGGLRTENTTVMTLLTFAYDLRDYQFANVPGWVKTEHYDVQFTPDKPEIALGTDAKRPDFEAQFYRQRHRMRAVLRDRFALELRVETRDLPMYALTIGKTGSKVVKDPDETHPQLSGGFGEIRGTRVPLNLLVAQLATQLGRQVVDETGLTGSYNFDLKWTPDGPPPGAMRGAPPPQVEAKSDEAGPSIFSSIQEQLGLKLEARRGPVPVVVINKIEKPKEN